MSSRQLRKLQQQRELEQAKLKEQEEHPESEEESEEEPVVPAKSKASLFANLAGLGNEDDEDEMADENEVDVPGEVNDPPTPPPAAKKAKKSKKKKQKKKGKDNAQGNEDHGGDSEDIDAVLRELNIKDAQKPASSQDTKLQVDPEYERVCALLSIGSQHLKVAHEMRNLFGKDFSTVDDDEDNRPGGRGGRRQRGQQQQVDLETALKGKHAPGKGLSSLTLRRNALIEGKQDWPRSTTGGLTMSIEDDKADDGTVEFRFVHDAQYQVVQQAFQAFVEMGNPENLIGLLQRNPYHISLLIQVSKIAKDQGDHALASDLLERALFTFGRAATSVFNTKVGQGKARLDFRRPENRELWLAGYHYIKSLIMKGTYRTALEWAKFLLSLDPEGDPYSMRLLIHQLALRAGENKWLLDVGESEIPDIWEPEQLGKIQAAAHTTPSLVLAAVKLKEAAKCRELLSESMQKLPWLFVQLFREISLDAPKSIWGIMPRTDAEKLFTELYILQTKEMWNTPEVTALLMEVAHTIPMVNIYDIPRMDNKEMTLDVVRFVYLENNPAIMRLAPSALLHRDNNSDSDPLPPDANIYSYESQKLPIEGRRRGGGDAFRGNYDPLAALARLIPGRLRALLERRRQGEANDDEIDELMEMARAGFRLDEDDDESSDEDSDEDSLSAPHRTADRPSGWLTQVLNSLFRGTLPATSGPAVGVEDYDPADIDMIDHGNAEVAERLNRHPSITYDESEEAEGEEEGTDDEMPGLI